MWVDLFSVSLFESYGCLAAYNASSCLATPARSHSCRRLEFILVMEDERTRTANLIYLHPLSALWRCPLVSQLRQGSRHPLVHGRTGGLAGEHGARDLQLLHPRLGQPLVTPHRDEGVRLGRRPRHPPTSREAVGGRGRRPARGPWAHVQRREAVRGRGIGVVLITVTQILRLGGWHLGFRYL